MMLSPTATRILLILCKQMDADGADLERTTGLSEAEIRAAARELKEHDFVTLSGAPNQNSETGEDFDRLEITTLGFMAGQNL